MVYCSIEEAWGTNFTNNKTQSKTNYDHIVADNASEHGDNSTFGEVDFARDNAYTKSGAPVLQRNRTSSYTKKKRRKSYSRNMNRLPNHSGPDNRYPEARNSKHLEFTDNDKMEAYPSKRLRDSNNSKSPSYQNTDTGISGYNNTLADSLVQHEDLKRAKRHHKKHRKHTPPPRRIEIDSETEYDSESEYNKQTDTEIEEEGYSDSEYEYPYQEEEAIHKPHRRENYKDLSESVYMDNPGHRRSKRLRENMFDIIIYVITGIFIIFILDVFVRLGRSTSSQ